MKLDIKIFEVRIAAYKKYRIFFGENFKIRGYYDEKSLTVLLKDEIKCRNVHFFNKIVKKICLY